MKPLVPVAPSVRIVLGVIGLISNVPFKALNRALVPWAQFGR